MGTGTTPHAQEQLCALSERSVSAESRCAQAQDRPSNPRPTPPPPAQGSPPVATASAVPLLQLGNSGAAAASEGHRQSGNARTLLPEEKARGFREGSTAPRPGYKRARCWRPVRAADLSSRPRSAHLAAMPPVAARCPLPALLALLGALLPGEWGASGCALGGGRTGSPPRRLSAGPFVFR